MSRRRSTHKRKTNAELFAETDEDDCEESKEDKRSKHGTDGTDAAAYSSSAAAAALSSAAAAAAQPGASSVTVGVAASSSVSALRVELEEVLCSACHEPFGCAADSAHLPRTLPCGHPLCTQCCKQSLALTPSTVLCPHEHGQCKIGSPGGVAAAAVSTVEGWLRLLPPRSDLVAAIRNQSHLMTHLGRQGARCCHAGCDAAVSHYCSECGELCSVHELKRHSLPLFQSHKAATVPIAQKAAALQSKLAGPAATIRTQIRDAVTRQQKRFQFADGEVKQLELQLDKKKQLRQAEAKALESLQLTADQMDAADDSTVLDIEASRLDAAAAASARPLIDSAILTTLGDERVAALHSFLGDDRLLSDAKLVYRGSRDGFKPDDWWRLCGGKSNLLTIIKAKGTGYVFGAFTPFQWPFGPEPESRWIADPSGTTFLFSLVNAHNRAVKLRLKERVKPLAGRLLYGRGPVIGDCDILLMAAARCADAPDGCVMKPNSFEFDCVGDGGAPIRYDQMLLAGNDSWSAAEVESWQL